MRIHQQPSPAHGATGALSGKTFLLLFATLLGCVVLPSPPVAATMELEEHELKAVFILNFSRVIQWSADISTIHLCIIGENPFAKTLEGVVTEFNKTAKLPRVVEYYHNVEHLENCQVLYIEMSLSQHIEQVLASVAKQPTLTVSSVDGFVFQGGMIQFYPKGDKLRFYINPKPLNRSGLNVDVNLLRIGDIVKVD